MQFQSTFQSCSSLSTIEDRMQLEDEFSICHFKQPTRFYETGFWLSNWDLEKSIGYKFSDFQSVLSKSKAHFNLVQDCLRYKIDSLFFSSFPDPRILRLRRYPERCSRLIVSGKEWNSRYHYLSVISDNLCARFFKLDFFGCVHFNPVQVCLR